MTTIINTFSNQKYLTKMPDVDLLIWISSVLRYKKLGYKVKLYCTPNDIQFLKDFYIYDLYDEIDMDCFDNTPYLNDGSIKDDKFWFIRKIAAIDNEYKIGDNDFIYSDVDIILFKAPIEYDQYDIYGWCLEHPAETEEEEKKTIENNIYCDWELISKPEGYEDLDYIVNMKRNIINGGLLHFSSREKFNLYKKHVLDFVINNPAKCATKEMESQGNILACNAEQRILAAVAKHFEWKIGYFDHNYSFNTGISARGCHYFICRAIWRMMDRVYDPTNLNSNSTEITWFIQKMIDVTKYSLRLMHKRGMDEAVDFYSQRDSIDKILKFDECFYNILTSYSNKKIDPKDIKDDEILKKEEI